MEERIRARLRATAGQLLRALERYQSRSVITSARRSRKKTQDADDDTDDGGRAAQRYEKTPRR